jgi:hypothetical protein
MGSGNVGFGGNAREIECVLVADIDGPSWASVSITLLRSGLGPMTSPEKRSWATNVSDSQMFMVDG